MTIVLDFYIEIIGTFYKENPSFAIVD